MSSLPSLTCLAAGVASHLLFFKQGERFLYPFRYVQALLLAIAVGTVTQIQYLGLSPRPAFSTSIRLTGIYLFGLYTSLLVYRLFFNPLNRIPGPFFARVSKFDHVIRNAKLDGHHKFLELHNKYGKFVRIGPNDISCVDADGVQMVLGANAKCLKSSWYQLDTPLISLHTTRDRAMHDRRRRVWAPAFSDKALRGYEGRIQIYNDLLVQTLEKTAGQSLNVSKWFNLYSFDVMGELGFGQSFNMLQSGEEHWAIKLLGEGLEPMGFAFPHWFFRFLLGIPGLTAGYFRFINFCSQRIDERIKAHGKIEKQDIAQTLIEHYNAADNKTDLLPMLQGDSRLIIVAGSDTTAATLVHLFYHLANEPIWQQKLRKEIRALVQPGQEIHNQTLQDAPVLNGVINEALRLNPPVPSGVFRKTPKDGALIGNTFVPGGTNIQMPQYVMGRDEDNYAHATSFLPERWSSSPELIKHKDAFGPFSTGPFGCIGKNLAYMEIRTLTAQIVDKFDVKFAPGEDGSTLLQKSTDHFTLGLGQLNLIFTKTK